jgi:hypothetical protein
MASLKAYRKFVLEIKMCNFVSFFYILSRVGVTIDGVWINGFIDHLQVVATNNYNTIAVFFPTHSVFTKCSLVAASNNGYSSSSALKSSLNGGFLPTEMFFRVRCTLRLAVYRQSVRLGDNPLRLTTSNFIF